MSEPPEPRPFPWDEAMALALNVLRWPPETFWRATPRELLAAIAGPRGVEPAISGDMRRLMQAFPDNTPVIPGRPEGPSPEPITTTCPEWAHRNRSA